MLLLFLAVNVALAAQASAGQKPASINQSKPLKKTDLTFLPLRVPVILPQPIEGDPLFKYQINFSLANVSNVASPATTVKVTCESLAGNPCPSGLSGIINFDALAPHARQRTSWPIEMNETWPKGEFKFTFLLDPDNKIPETNKKNNSFSQTLLVKEKIAGQHKETWSNP